MNKNKVNKDNFFIATVGLWQEIVDIPSGFSLFFESKDSMYYINKTERTVVRVSDHWGSGIRYCNWYLRGRRNNNSMLFQKFNKNCGALIGIINFDKLTDISNIYK